MPLAQRRYDRLAVRLSLIISRLVAGETLDMQKLATEFDVSVRTLYRDFRERLIYLDLECHQGCYRLRSGAGPQGELDVLTFAHRTGIAGLFPGLDRRLVNLLLNCEGAPCLTGDAVSAGSPATPLSFYRLVQAITTCQRVTLLAEEGALARGRLNLAMLGSIGSLCDGQRLAAQHNAAFGDDHVAAENCHLLGIVMAQGVRLDVHRLVTVAGQCQRRLVHHGEWQTNAQTR